MLKEFADVLEVGLRTYALVREKVAASLLPVAEQEQGVQALRRYEARCADRLGRVSELVKWIEADRSQIDPARLPSESGGRGAEGYVGLDTFEADFLARG